MVPCYNACGLKFGRKDHKRKLILRRCFSNLVLGVDLLFWLLAFNEMSGYFLIPFWSIFFFLGSEQGVWTPFRIFWILFKPGGYKIGIAAPGFTGDLKSTVENLCIGLTLRTSIVFSRQCRWFVLKIKYRFLNIKA